MARRTRKLSRTGLGFGLALGLATLGVGCSSRVQGDPTSPQPDPLIADRCPSGADIATSTDDKSKEAVIDAIPAIRAPGISVNTELVTAGLTAPVFGTAAPGITNWLYVIEQTGAMWRLNPDTGDKLVVTHLGRFL